MDGTQGRPLAVGEREQETEKRTAIQSAGGPRYAVALVALAAVAVILRAARYPTVDAWVAGNGGYDPAVMFSAATALLSGEVPYHDFVFLHPPGVLVALAPFAALSTSVGDSVALALATTTVFVLGVINTLLVAALLRRFGLTAVVSGAGLYAVWSATVYAEQVVMLEPALNFALLLSLVALRRKSALASVFAGAVMGFAVMTKLWAVVDVLVISAMIWATSGWARTRWWIAGVALGGAAIGLPFFLHAPAAMWQQIVLTQLARPRADVSLLKRAAMFGPAPFLTHPVYQLAMLAVLVGACVLCAWLIDRNLAKARISDSEPGWWAIMALAHLAILALSASYYDHYTAWAAPLCLVVGYWLGRAVSPLESGPRRMARVATVLCLALLAAATLAGSLVRGLEKPAHEDRAMLSAWAAHHDCVWAARPVDLLAADALARNAANGCATSIDPFGTTLAAAQEGKTPDETRTLAQEERWSQMTRATGLILPTDLDGYELTQERREQMIDRCQPVGASGPYTLWDCR